MPELPEVETIKNQLQKKIVGKKIKAMEIKLAKMVQGTTIQQFKKVVISAKIKNLDRRGKVLIIYLDNNYSLLIHLKLSGQIIYRNKKLEIRNQEKAHIIYYFNDSSVLLHNDLRQFGWVKLIRTSELEKYFQKEGFGLEPLSKEFSLEKFKELLSKKPRQKIKSLLMDQKFITGIGNIYAQEACFCATTLPTRLVKTLKDKEIKNLYFCLIKILKKAIQCQGSSIDDYLDAEGEKGNYVPHLKVYNREKEKCYRCQGKIKKITLAGRGTYYCPKCQK